MSDRLPVSLTPVAPPQKRETEEVADRIRLDLTRLEERQRRAQQRHAAEAETFDALGDLALTVQGIVQDAGAREALTTRQKATSTLAHEATNWVRNAPESGIAPSEMMGEFVSWYDRQREQLSEAIQFVPQRDLFVAETERAKLSLAAEVADLGQRLTIEQGRAVHQDTLSQYIASGDIEGVDALWEDSVEANLYAIEELGPGGAREQSIRLASMRVMESQGQAVFEQEGWDGFNEWIADPDNHPARWKETAGYLDDRARALGTIRSNVAEQAKAQLAQLEQVRGNEMAQFIVDTIPIKDGTMPVTLNELQDLAATGLPSHTPLKRAETVAKIWESTRKYRMAGDDAGKAAAAQRNREAIVDLERLSLGLDQSNKAQFLDEVNDRFLAGDITPGGTSTVPRPRLRERAGDRRADEAGRSVPAGARAVDDHDQRRRRAAAEAGRVLRQRARPVRRAGPLRNAEGATAGAAAW